MNFISAYMLINKAIPNSGGPFKVRFYDENGTLIQTSADVPLNGRASCTLLDGTYNSDAQYFKGWNPAPDIVQQDMDCFPVYGDVVISVEEIHDDWAAILQDNGAHYPIGAFKTISYVGEWTREEIYDEFGTGMGFQGLYSPNSSTHSKNVYRTIFNTLMVKVAEGEDGSTSTWLSAVVPIYTNSAAVQTETLGSDEEGTYYRFTFNDQMFALQQGNGLSNWDYRQSITKKFLNGLFYDKMPENIKSHIKAVYKDTQYSINVRPPYNAEQTSEKIWIPSVKEMCTIDGNDIMINSPFDNYSQYEANVLKYVTNVRGIAYIKDMLQFSIAERDALFLYNADYGVKLRDVTNDKNGPWGGWQTPYFRGAYGTIINLSTDGRNTNKGWLDTNASSAGPARHFIFGFCL